MNPRVYLGFTLNSEGSLRTQRPGIEEAMSNQRGALVVFLKLGISYGLLGSSLRLAGHSQLENRGLGGRWFY
jgi:hypothetical protein